MRGLLAVVILLLIVSAAWAEQRELVFGSTGEEESHVGAAVLKAAYAKLDIPIIVTPMPAGRSLAEADLGRTDGEVIRIAAIEAQHPELIRIPVPVTAFEGMAYTCNKELAVSDWDSIRHLRIGIRTGIRFMERATYSMPHVTSMMELDTLFDLLCKDRLDVVVATGPTGFLQMRKQRPGTLTEHRPPLISLDLFHYLNRKHAELVPRITAELRAMQASGEIDRIRAQASLDYRRLAEQTGP